MSTAKTREAGPEQGFSTAQDTLLRSDSRLAIAIVFILTLGLALGAFLLSFEALQQLAEASSIQLAWLWPLIIDGFIITATIASYVLRGRRSVSWYAWASLVLFAGASIAGNAVHALLSIDSLRIPVWAAALVNSAPPIALLIASHLLIIMLSSPRKRNLPSPSHLAPAPERKDEPESKRQPTAQMVVTNSDAETPAPQVTPAVAARPVAVAATAARPAASPDFEPHAGFVEYQAPASGAKSADATAGTKTPAKAVQRAPEGAEAPTAPKTDAELREWVTKRETDGKPVSPRAVAGFLGRGTTLTEASARLASVQPEAARN